MKLPTNFDDAPPDIKELIFNTVEIRYKVFLKFVGEITHEEYIKERYKKAVEEYRRYKRAQRRKDVRIEKFEQKIHYAIDIVPF